ncbi:AfsR/SARP family transcriptional regulator [Streptomyces cyaneochromogenes]|uniref:AfsR/SARP family transcriptional regulator n=1 Tax=Streptomyces cyaneochromogenes TaxID=2496836 RepID=A0A3S9M587_9ACTN|nr:BTAD domain-containing putative transcriptional regulator [Streptomyces cyaneochromogenes]AZQ34317.1 AfsR/SARP family transcriptional regulator [Streptomyces cyaneochromogenes]
MDPVRYRILGTTQALRPDGTPVPVGGARLRALLTVLALRGGRAVPVSRLVEEVWDGDPPADASGALQALVGRLRRALGADAVVSAEGGYRLAAAPEDIDLYRFERLAGEGTRALADGDLAKAAVALDDALALWHGPALADLPDRTAEAARQETRRLDALRARHTAALALGHAEHALPELTALCDTHPLDEPLQALRLRALRDAGRTAEALAAYDAVRRLLADRLGSDPGRELRALHGELLRSGADTDGGGAGQGARDGGRFAPGARRGSRDGRGAGVDGAADVEGRPPRFAGGGAGASGMPGGAGAGWGAGTPAAPSDTGTGTSGRAPGEGADTSRPAPGAGPGVRRWPSGSGAGAPRTSTHPAVPAAPDPRAPADQSGAPVPGSPDGSGAPSAPRARTAAAADAAPGPLHSLDSRTGPGEPPAQARAAGTRPGTAPAPPTGNLRARLTSFVGREADIDAIRGDLTAARLVTLLGPGGAGKTRLSQEAAESGRDAAPDGVWLAELAPVDDPQAVPEAVLTAVGARETVLYGAGAEAMRAGSDRHDDPVERLAEHCGKRRMLLILDNCEHVVEAAARLVEELLERCPALTVLATSREPLGVPGELLRPVDPLPEPVALRLLADRGAAARPGFRTDTDEETAAACAEICRRLDGLPLAIELAAARLRVLTPRQIADRLDDRFRLLTSGSRTVLPRQQTLRAVVDWSWELLDEDERDVLRGLSVFAGGCELAAAEAVCGPGALEALGSLVDKSLVVAAPSGDGEMRYRLLETVAEYAAERLDETGGRAEVERAHLTYYRELARTGEPSLRGAGQLAAIRRLERESENIRAALHHAVAVRDEQEAMCLVLSMAWYWLMRDQRVVARNWAREIQDLGPDPFSEPVRPAAPMWERCITTPPPWTGEVLAEARRGVHLVHLACMDTELEAWQSPEGQRKLRAVGGTYRPGLPQGCRFPGSLWFYAVLLTGDLERVRTIIDAAVDTCRGVPGYEWDLAANLQMRANLLANRTEWSGDATRDADESLAIYRRLGDLWGTAEALAARAEAHERRGEYRMAAADYEAALESAAHLGARGHTGVLKARLASVLIEAGEAERGERLLREVLDQAGGPHDQSMPFARLILAGRLGMTGRVPEAREQLRLLREQFKIAHFIVFDAFILGAEAWLDAADGRYPESLERIRGALERAEDPLSQAIAPQMRSGYLTTAAYALARVDGGSRAHDAARCLGAADALLPPRHVPSSQEREVYERAVAGTRAALGDAAYEAAYAEGGGLSSVEAAALV